MHGVLDRFDWTDTAIESLKAKVAERLPASVIAADLGVSRNAIIGKAHRLGLAMGRPNVVKRQRSPEFRVRKRESQRRPEYRLHRQERERDAAIRCEPEPNARNLTVLELEANDCHWPVTGDHPFLFCGHPIVEGKPYCAHHCGRAYEPGRRLR